MFNVQINLRCLVAFVIMYVGVASTPILSVLDVGDRWVEVSWVISDDTYSPVRNFTLQKQQSSFAFTDAADYVPSAVRNFTVLGSAHFPSLIYQHSLVS